MANKHVSLVVRSELASILKDHAQTPAVAIPPALHYPANVETLGVILDGGVLPALQGTHAGDAALGAYALPLVRSWLAAKQWAASTAPSKAFADAIADNLHPIGSYFERYIARFFEDAASALACPGVIAAVAVHGADLLRATKARTTFFTFHSTIYEADRQQSLLDASYDRFEQYYLAALDRFGPKHSDTILPSCCNALRAELGSFMQRLRDPRRANEREWLALARSRKPDGHVLVGSLHVPWLGIDRQRTGRASGPRTVVYGAGHSE